MAQTDKKGGAMKRLIAWMILIPVAFCLWLVEKITKTEFPDIEDLG